MKGKFLIAITLAIFALGFSQKPPAKLLSDLAVRPLPRLGLAFPGDDPAQYHRLAEAGIGLIRLDWRWSLREPQLDVYNWGGVDRRIQVLDSLGMEILFTFVPDAPEYTQPSSYENNRIPKAMDHWARFVEASVKQCPQVKLWQGINEWTNPGGKVGGWPGTVDQFVALNNATFDAVKRANPEAQFVLGGISSGSLDAVLENRVPADMMIRFGDMVNLSKYNYTSGHFYGTSDQVPAKVQVLRSLGAGAPVLSTECGGPRADVYTPEAHFLAVLDINLTAFASGVEACFWFRGAEGGSATEANSRTALFTREGEPKPGYWAYFLLAAVMDGATDVAGSNPFIVQYEDGTARTVAWGTGVISGEGQILRVTNVELGQYVLEKSATVKLGRLPVVVGAPLKVRTK